MMPKQLAEFLQEQQEPFILEVHLLERGHRSPKNRFHSSESSSCNNSTRVDSRLKRSITWSLKRDGKLIPTCSKVVRALVSKLLIVNSRQKFNNTGIRHQQGNVSEIDRGRQEVADEEIFTSGSSTTVFNSCSESDVEDAHYLPKEADILLAADHQEPRKDGYVLAENEVDAGWKFRRRGAEDSKQLSPVSVLGERESCNVSPVEHEAGTKQKRLSKSISRCKSEKPICERTEEIQEFVGSISNASSHYSKNKNAVQQTRQLLFDCVREVVEKHKKETGGQQFQELVIGAEQMWELICDNLCLWSKESINETNITHLVHSDLLISAQEWNDFQKQTQEIGFGLGDTILEDISNEIITDMTRFYREK